MEITYEPKRRERTVNFRISEFERRALEAMAEAEGHVNLSEFLRAIVREAIEKRIDKVSA